MEDTIGAKLKKTAGEVAQRIGEAAQNASERIGEARERDRITTEITKLAKEKEQVRQGMLDLLIRMFDNNTVVDALLRPDYLRIKEIDAEIAHLEKERTAIGKTTGKEAGTAQDAKTPEEPSA